MILNTGEKIHIMVRRAFPGDVSRHFVGEVKGVTETAIRVEGYSFVFSEIAGEYQRKPELRTRIFSLTAERIIINVIPTPTVIEKVSYRLSKDNSLIATDGEHFQLDINEFGARR